MKHHTGFTMMELIIVIVILGILAAGSATMMTEGLTNFFTSQNLVDANWQGRIALARMARDIAAIRSPLDLSSASTASTLTFTDTNANTITYTLSSGTITRTVGTTRNLADGVGSLTFNYYDTTGAAIAVPLGANNVNVYYINVTITETKNNANFTYFFTINPRGVV